MTRKDYIRIANAVADARSCALCTDELIGMDRIMETLTRELKADNPRFKPEAFEIACTGRDYLSPALSDDPCTCGHRVGGRVYSCRCSVHGTATWTGA